MTSEVKYQIPAPDTSGAPDSEVEYQIPVPVPAPDTSGAPDSEVEYRPNQYGAGRVLVDAICCE